MPWPARIERRAYIIYGGALGDEIDLGSLTGDQGLIFETAFSLAADNMESIFAGDFNGDGYDDVVIGSPRANNIDGAVYVLYGREAGTAGQPDVIADTDLDGDNGFVILGEDQWTLGDGIATVSSTWSPERR